MHIHVCIYGEQMSGGREKYESLWTMSDAKIAVPISDVHTKGKLLFSPSSSLDHISLDGSEPRALIKK